MARLTGNRTQEQQVADRDLLGTYLSEIGRVPLLSAEEEVELAKRIEAGLFAGQLLDRGLVEPRTADAADEELATLAVSGQRAKDEFIQANLRLVVAVARKYSGRGMPLIDLVQEGNLGRVRAVEKFDYRRGYKFSTYATWWIRQSVTRAIADKARTIRIPVHMVEKLNKVAHVERQLVQELGREPTPEEIAAQADCSAREVKDILRIAQQPVSLEKPIGEEEASE